MIQPAIRFSANIHFIPMNDFFRLKREIEAQEVAQNWELQDSDQFNDHPSSFTTSAGVCTLGGVSNRQVGSLFHLLGHEVEKLTKSPEKFIAAIRRLAQAKQPLSFVLAGASLAPKGSIMASLKLLNDLKTRGFTPSYFLGQKSGVAGTHILYHAPQDAWYISCMDGIDGGDKAFSSPETKAGRAKALEKIKSHYEYRFVAPQDKLYIRDTEIPVEEVQTVMNQA
jgi:hypothetical protein